MGARWQKAREALAARQVLQYELPSNTIWVECECASDDQPNVEADHDLLMSVDIARTRPPDCHWDGDEGANRK